MEKYGPLEKQQQQQQWINRSILEEVQASDMLDKYFVNEYVKDARTVKGRWTKTVKWCMNKT